MFIHHFNSTVKALIQGLLLTAALGLPTTLAQPADSVAAAPVLRLRILGGLADLNQYTRHEQPFWSRELARLSQGKYSADIIPFDKAGVPGSDMLRLLKLGVVPFGTSLVSSMGQQYSPFVAMDLAGLNPDMTILKRNVAAFRPYLENALRSRYNIQLLALYTYPAQVLFCKQPFSRLQYLKGRHIRVSSSTQSDFVSALGALPVVTGFAQIMANLASGNIDCAITGTMSGNTLGLHDATRHISGMPITWGLAMFAANGNAWDALPPDLRALISRELPQLEARIWAESEQETTEGLACNTGASACSGGHRGSMALVRPDAADQQLRLNIFKTHVLPHWLQRCGVSCTDIWNQTIGQTSGIAAKVTP
ncbi:MAG: TRAP transporter substrate-binding protein [Rhodoferax sp.]